MTFFQSFANQVNSAVQAAVVGRPIAPLGATASPFLAQPQPQQYSPQPTVAHMGQSQQQYHSPYSPVGGAGGVAVGTSPQTIPGPLPFVTEAMSRPSSAAGAKSLIFCLVLDNPFDREKGDHRCVDETTFTGVHETLRDGSTNKLPFPYLHDDELLLNYQQPNATGSHGSQPQGPSSGNYAVSHSGTPGSSFMDNLAASLVTGGDGPSTPAAAHAVRRPVPNKHQKVIEILLRLYNRGIDVYPNDMLVPVTGNSAIHENYLHGYALRQESLLLSPDQDEMFVKIHASKSVMLTFAEEQGVHLPTHPYSYAGGAPMCYSKKAERELTESVTVFRATFPAGIRVQEKDEDTNDGFLLDVPDKMRLVDRMMREGWVFGGCGLQIDEMRHQGVLVRHFFPLHNEVYQRSYALDKWSEIPGVLLSMHPVQQDLNAIRKYFGEEVALYFGWMATYCLFLRYIAVTGFIFGVIQGVGSRYTATDNPVVVTRVVPLCNAIFSVICVVWGVAWNLRSARFEQWFSVRFGQEAFVAQQLARDEFQAEKRSVLSVYDLFHEKFDVPLTLKLLKDGTLLNLYYNPSKRLAWRWLVGYPAIAALTAVMVLIQVYITRLRLGSCSSAVSSTNLSGGSSFLYSVMSVATSVGFGLVFDRVVPMLNALENNRTDTEESEQTIIKSFFFYFFSNYFVLFAIALWPTCATANSAAFTLAPSSSASAASTGSTGSADLLGDVAAALEAIVNVDKLNEMMYQMLVITVVKPMINDVIEVGIPIWKTRRRLLEDQMQAAKIGHSGANIMRLAEALPLHREAQKEPYQSTGDDYLEVAIQFGFMTMFASTFPFAATAGILYMALEIRVDSYKLVHIFRRPVAKAVTGIGAWRGIFLFLSAMSVITNGFNVAVLSYFPSALRISTDSASRYKAFIVAQYIIVALYFAVFSVYARTSPKTERIRAKQALVGNTTTRGRMTDELRSRTGGKDVGTSHGSVSTKSSVSTDGAPGASATSARPVSPHLTTLHDSVAGETNEDVSL